MTNPPPHEWIVPERPVRSDFARSDALRARSYARRRVMTLCVLALIIGGVVYVLWGHKPPNPADIPTIKAEGAYKQKPSDPGGIDIPHQDVRVYDELESKGAPPAPIEHLLPPPETPKDMPHPVAAAPAPVPAPPPEATPMTAAPVVVLPPARKTVKDDIDHVERAVKPVATTVTPALAPASVPEPVAVAPSPVPAPSPPTPSAPPTSIDQVLAEARSLAPAGPAPAQPKTEAAVGNTAVQLASVNDEGSAQAMMAAMQVKYAVVLDGVPLRLSRADLGAKGVYYRIQSQTLPEDRANHICSVLKQMKAGCILVRK